MISRLVRFFFLEVINWTNELKGETMKKIIALLLTLSLVFTFTTPAFAANKSTALKEVSVSSFVDGEGKKNTVYVSSSQIGTAHVEYYIDGVLTNTVDAELLDFNSADIDSVRNSSDVRIIYSDISSATSQSYVEPLSNYLGYSQITTESSKAASAYSYQGKIKYNTYYDWFGNQYNDKLSIYQQTGSTTYEYKTVNAAQGAAASVVIAVIAAALTVVCPALAAVASNLLYAAAYAVGTTIVGGVVQGAITKQYYVRTTSYSVKARDVSTSRENIYDAERYQIALSGGGYSSEYYYEGYLPWRTNAVAYWMFCDFWAYNYPGVSSYT